jgi:hypothetical protein
MKNQGRFTGIGKLLPSNEDRTTGFGGLEGKVSMSGITLSQHVKRKARGPAEVFQIIKKSDFYYWIF